jgi:hypothetical protein
MVIPKEIEIGQIRNHDPECVICLGEFNEVSL